MTGKHSIVSIQPPGVNSSVPPREDQVFAARDKVERRRGARYFCHDPVQIRILSGDASRILAPATILDVSRSGLRLEIADPLAKGMEIEIMSQEVIIFGEVRHCRSAGDTFHAGVSIEDVFYTRRCDTNHLHLYDDELSAYLARKGLTAAEVLGARDHLQRCKLCAARHHAALEVRERLHTQATE